MRTKYQPHEQGKSSTKSHPWRAAFSARRIQSTEVDGRTLAQPIAETQRDRVLRILGEAGAAGVTNLELTFKHRISQSATRVHELRAEWCIDSMPTGDGDGSVRYFLRGRIESSKPVAEPGGFFQKRATGLPLFDLGLQS